MSYWRSWQPTSSAVRAHRCHYRLCCATGALASTILDPKMHSSIASMKQLAVSTETKIGAHPVRATTKTVQKRKIIRPEVHVIEHHFMWEISEFSSRAPDSYFSSDFKVDKGDGTTTTWELQMEIKENGSIGLFAVLIDAPKKELAWVRFGIVDANGETVISGGVFLCVFYPDSVDERVWGYVDLTNREYLLKHKETMLPRDKLSAFCDLQLVTKQMDTATDIGQGVVTASLDMLELYVSAQYTDCVIACKERELKALRAILAARSPVFAAMFAHQLAESRTSRIEVPDISAEIMDELLQHVYSGVIPTKLRLRDIAEDLFVGADKYQLLELKEACAQSMSRWLSTDDVCRYLLLADQRHCPSLKIDCIRFLKAYVSNPAELGDFAKLSAILPNIGDELTLHYPEFFVDKTVARDVDP